MYKSDIAEALTKCPVCDSDVNYIQSAREYLALDVCWDDDGVVEDIHAAVADMMVDPGDLLESRDFDFLEIRCDDTTCGASWTNINAYKDAVAEKLNR